jgi:CheY-like chemotaxis protein
VKILIVDDEPSIRESTVACLAENGWSATAVTNGKTALESHAREGFDLILMDVQMPGMDGFEATRRIRELESRAGGHVPIIGYTAYSFEGGRNRFCEGGMDDLLSKPAEPPSLIAMIEHWHPKCQKPVSQDLVQTKLADLLERRRKKKELIATLINSMDEAQKEALKAFLEGDASQLEFWSHRMAGALAVFGFDKARDLARGIETLAVSSRLEETEGLIELLGREVEKIKASLAEEEA